MKKSQKHYSTKNTLEIWKNETPLAHFIEFCCEFPELISLYVPTKRMEWDVVKDKNVKLFINKMLKMCFL